VLVLAASPSGTGHIVVRPLVSKEFVAKELLCVIGVERGRRVEEEGSKCGESMVESTDTAQEQARTDAANFSAVIGRGENLEFTASDVSCVTRNLELHRLGVTEGIQAWNNHIWDKTIVRDCRRERPRFDPETFGMDEQSVPSVLSSITLQT